MQGKRLTSMIFLSFLPGGAQVFLLALHSGVTPGGIQGTLWGVGVNHVQRKCLSHSPSSLAPQMHLLDEYTKHVKSLLFGEK